jgi:predicted Na+-dependent transporter
VCRLVSVVTVPLTANLVLPQPDRVKLAAGAYILKLVLFQLLPLVIGYLIADRAAALARKLVRPVLLIFAGSAVAFIAMLGGKILTSFATVYGSGGMLAAFALVVLSIGVAISSVGRSRPTGARSQSEPACATSVWRR